MRKSRVQAGGITVALATAAAIAGPVSATPSTEAAHAGSPRVTQSERAEVAQTTRRLFQAQNQIWEDGQSAARRLRIHATSSTSQGEDAFDDALDDAINLRRTVTDENLEVVSSATSTQILSVTENIDGTFTAKAVVSIAQRYRDLGNNEVTEAGWDSTFIVDLAPAQAPGRDAATRVDDPDDSVEVIDTRRESDESTVLEEDESPGTVMADRSGLERANAPAEDQVVVDSFNRETFQNYMLAWTSVNAMNPAYPNLSNDCANFVSQALHDAGWDTAGGVNPRDPENWHYNLTGPAGPSRTWSQALSLFKYVKNVRALLHMKNIWNAAKGGLYFVDWDRDGDSVIDHVAGVTGRTSRGVPRISQKTANRYNILLTTWLEIIAESTGPDPIFYARRPVRKFPCPTGSCKTGRGGAANMNDSQIR